VDERNTAFILYSPPARVFIINDRVGTAAEKEGKYCLWRSLTLEFYYINIGSDFTKYIFTRPRGGRYFCTGNIIIMNS